MVGGRDRLLPLRASDYDRARARNDVGRIRGFEDSHDANVLTVELPGPCDVRRQRIDFGSEQFTDMRLKVGPSRRLPTFNPTIVFDTEEDEAAKHVRERGSYCTESRGLRRLTFALDVQRLAVICELAQHRRGDIGERKGGVCSGAAPIQPRITIGETPTSLADKPVTLEL